MRFPTAAKELSATPFDLDIRHAIARVARAGKGWSSRVGKYTMAHRYADIMALYLEGRIAAKHHCVYASKLPTVLQEELAGLGVEVYNHLRDLPDPAPTEAECYAFVSEAGPYVLLTTRNPKNVGKRSTLKFRYAARYATSLSSCRRNPATPF